MPPSSTYLSPKTRKQESPVHGTGLFAAQPIAKGEIVAVKGGHVMPYDEWRALEDSVGEAAEVQISADLVIAPRSAEEYAGSMMHLNHSCEPNVGVQGQIVFVTLRDVAEGEELTLDYAMFDDHDERMACRCGRPSCRGTVDGQDWRNPALQERYRGHFSAYLAERIAEATHAAEHAAEAPSSSQS